MAVALATSTDAYFKVLDEGQSLRVLCNIKVSDSYATGGEDLSTILSDYRIKSEAVGQTRFFSAYAESSNGNRTAIPFAVGTSPVKLKFFSAAATELAEDVYPSEYTDDLIRLDFSIPKLGSMGV